MFVFEVVFAYPIWVCIPLLLLEHLDTNNKLIEIVEMAGNSELMDVIRLNVDNHHAKLSDVLFRKWAQLQEQNKIGEKKTAFHLSTVIDLKIAIVDYFEGSNLRLSWGKTSEEDQNGICSVLLMDFLIELSLTLHTKLKPGR